MTPPQAPIPATPSPCTDKITSLDPAGSYDNGSYAVQIQVFPFLYAQDYNTSELSPDIATDDGTWNDDGTEFTVKPTA